MSDKLTQMKVAHVEPTGPDDLRIELHFSNAATGEHFDTRFVSVNTAFTEEEVAALEGKTDAEKNDYRKGKIDAYLAQYADTYEKDHQNSIVEGEKAKAREGALSAEDLNGLQGKTF